jgi:tetratricopeptide (TPR) repeat protein
MSAEALEPTGSTGVVRTSFSHRGLALIGWTLILFEILFVILLAAPFWLDVKLVPLSAPAIVLMAIFANFILIFLESSLVCRMVRFVLNGRPLLVYRQWISFDEQGFTFGIKRTSWDVIDEASLNFYGTLLIKSRKLCGPAKVVNGTDVNPPDVIIKLPFAAIAFASQNYFVKMLLEKRPDITLNARLQKQIAQPLVKGMQYVQGASVIFLALALLDLGYATFAYLETLKQYYLCRVDAAASHMDSAQDHFLKGEDLRLHPLPISYITPRLTSLGGVSENYQQARWEALWALGKRQEALAVAKDVADHSPKGFRSHLRVARLYSELGDEAAAEAQIKQAIEKRDDALLPRLYQIAYFLGQKKADQAKKSYDEYSTKLDEEVFGQEPGWPPGDVRYVDSVWYKGDLNYVLKRVLGGGSK